MEVSIIIVNYNTKILTKQCLQSVFEKTRDIVFEIIVVDNASHDGSQEMLREEFPNVTLIESRKNLGFGCANNLGAKLAKGKFLFFLNPDTILLNNAIKICSDFLNTNSQAGICGGNLFDINGKPMRSYGYIPGIAKELRFLFAINEYFNYSNKPKTVGYIIGADLMIRADIFTCLSGFDSDFFIYYEETELTYRVKKAGYQVYNVPQSKIIHLEGQSSDNKHRIKWSLKSRELYYRKTHRWLYRKIADTVYIMTLASRLIIFTILYNTKKIKHYKFCLLNYYKKNKKNDT